MRSGSYVVQGNDACTPLTPIPSNKPVHQHNPANQPEASRSYATQQIRGWGILVHSNGAKMHCLCRLLPIGADGNAIKIMCRALQKSAVATQPTNLKPGRVTLPSKPESGASWRTQPVQKCIACAKCHQWAVTDSPCKLYIYAQALHP